MSSRLTITVEGPELIARALLDPREWARPWLRFRIIRCGDEGRIFSLKVLGFVLGFWAPS